MNIKYKQLSVIGKIWTIADMFYAGIRDDKNAYVLATLRRLEELDNDEEIINSNAVQENTISKLIDCVETKQDLVFDDESIISKVWSFHIEINNIKARVKTDRLMSEDVLTLNKIHSQIKGFWVRDLKQKNLSSKERRDLFKIVEEIEDLKIKIENRINRNQINLI